MGEPGQPEAIRTELEGGVAILTIDRPEVRNALDTASWLAMRDALRSFASDRAVRAIVLTGVGERAFCAGADLREPFMTAAEVRDYGDLPPPLQAVREIVRSSKPVLAAVNGDAVGGGLELVLACHLSLAARTARLGLPEIRFGLVPAAARLLPQLVGRSRAFELLLLGELIGAEEAQALGLVGRLCEGAELLPRTLELARSIATRDPFAVAGVLHLARAALGLGPEERLNAAAAYYAAVAAEQPARRPESS